MNNPVLQVLSPDTVRKIYDERLVYDFPPDEVKPFPVIESAMSRRHYTCYGLQADGEIIAYAFFVVNGTDALLDYYAVRQDLRGRGYGSRFLRLLSASLRDTCRCVLLEVEDPDFAENGADRENMERRLRFYLRNGIRETGVTARVWGVDFRVLEMPLSSSAPAEDPARVYSLLYHVILPKDVYREKVIIGSGCLR